jgi:hypothetical protein
MTFSWCLVLVSSAILLLIRLRTGPYTGYSAGVFIGRKIRVLNIQQFIEQLPDERGCRDHLRAMAFMSFTKKGCRPTRCSVRSGAGRMRAYGAWCTGYAGDPCLLGFHSQWRIHTGTQKDKELSEYFCVTQAD